VSDELVIPEGLVHRDDLLVAEANSIIKVIEDLNGQIATAVMQRRRLEVVLSAIEASLNAPPDQGQNIIEFSQ
jgi:hypothetical protein